MPSAKSNFTRRDFIKASAAGLTLPLLTAFSSGKSESKPESDQLLLKNATVLTMDDELGDFETADILIDGEFIRKISPSIEEDVESVDASDHIIIPGFVDTHRHMWQGVLRNILPDGLLSDYMRVVTGSARSVFRPDDAYIGNLVSALGAIDAGITTILDWSHIGNSPDHTDAAIRGLEEAGIRGVYAFGSGDNTPENRHPEDIERLKKEYFSSDDQLLTLAIGAGINADQWDLARKVDARISVHVNGTGDLLPLAEHLGPDVTCIHCCNLLDEEWELLAQSGTGVSISSPVEMIMGHGIPPIQQTLDYGILPSLSVDVETTVPGNMFKQMQSVYTLQRMQILARERKGEENLPALLTPKQILKFATTNGAVHNGLNEKIGSLSPGKKADLVMLRKDHINTMPINNAYGAVVLGMDRSNIDGVIINGSIKKWNGKLLHKNIDRIKENAVQSQRYIYEQSELDYNLF